MGTVDGRNLRFSVRNVALWGDTDVLPFPIENHWFHDDEDTIVGLLEQLDGEFEKWSAEYPLTFCRALSVAGYLGFRAPTQIDPIWNAYLLGLAVELGGEIEKSRIPIASHRVFSYRFSPDFESSSLFDRDVGWAAFQSHALKVAEEAKYIVSTDISDFYPRVYHHRIENALQEVTGNKEAVRRVSKILSSLSVGGVSYGLPVGGHAARILAELLLNRTDSLLETRGVQFCRFVDDYYLFADSEAEARAALVVLADLLQLHEGLSLNRSKTRIMTREEFNQVAPLAKREFAESQGQEEAQEFLKIRLKYDPYSPTAVEDFEQLREELNRFDVVGMLARELRKSRIDEALVRQLVKSIRYLSPRLRDLAVQSLVENLAVLYPVFPTVALVIRALLGDLSADLQVKIFRSFRALIEARSHILLVPANLCFAMRVLVEDPSDATDVLFHGLYGLPECSMMTKRDVILCMARRQNRPWIADAVRRYGHLSEWEKRALLAASYVLGDEGKHFRRRIGPQLHEVEARYLSWVGEKNDGQVWEIPV
jgi:hypothetical protein